MEDQQLQKAGIQRLSFRDLFYKYIRFLPLYILFIILALLGAWLYLRYTQESYNAVGTMLVNTGANSGDKVDELMSGGIKDKSLQNEIEVLHSRPLLERVVKKLNLQWGYTIKGKVKDLNAYKRSPFEMQALQMADSNIGFSASVNIINNQQFKLNGASTHSFGQTFQLPQGLFRLVKNGQATPGTEYIVSYTPSRVMAAMLAPAISVQPKIPNTSILTIVTQTSSPQLAADIVNGVMTEYNEMSVEQNTSSLISKIDFTDKRLVELQGDIDSIKNKMVRFQKNNNLISAESQIQDHLSEAREQNSVAQSQQIALDNLYQIESYLNANRYAPTPVPSNLGIGDATLTGLIGRYNEAQLQRKNLLESKVTEEHPRMIALDENIQVLRANILESIRVLKRSYQQMQGLASSEKGKNKSEALNLPEKANEQKDLERQLQSKQALYDMLNGNREINALSASGVLSGGKIIEIAEPNGNPVSPDTKSIKLMAILLGLLIPTAFIFIRELLNDRINTRADIQKVTEAPILGEIGHSTIGKALVVNRLNRSLLAEQFRILRSNLQYIIGKKDKAVILISSSFSGEGKSFISTNMGAVLALTDKKTIILEFDLRKPRIVAGLDMSKKPGVSNYMVGNKGLDELIVPVQGEDNLYILPCGPIPPNPAELLLSDRINDLFIELRKQFDYIVIDTAPVGMVSDALTLGKYADCTLYVTRQGRTFKKQIGLVDEIYKQKKLPHLSIILNDVKMPTGGGYYGNYGYGYYGSKGQNGYYDDEVRTKSVGRKVADAINPANWFKKS